MKIIGLVIVTMWGILLRCFAQEPESFSPEYKSALHNGAKAKVTLAVSASDGSPVSNAVLKIRFTLKYDRSDIVEGITDTKGSFTATRATKEFVGGTVEKEDFYQSSFMYHAANRDPERLKDGRWLPWNPTIPVILREIRNPIPLYATGVDFRKEFPCDMDVGFDAQKRDWVAPHGAGEISDFTLRITALDFPETIKLERESIILMKKTATDRNQIATLTMDLWRIDSAYYQLVLSATDGDGGFIRKRKFSDSKFVSDYEAPTNGYSTTFTTSMGKLPYFQPPNPADLSGEEYLIFKSRIVRNNKGEVISANYGKIYGPLLHSISRSENQGLVSFRPYFNSTSNDGNIEWNGLNIANGEKWGDFQP